VVHPLNQCDFRRCCDTETTWDAMAPSAPPNKDGVDGPNGIDVPHCGS
jgi:hypothetical protein